MFAVSKTLSVTHRGREKEGRDGQDLFACLMPRLTRGDVILPLKSIEFVFAKANMCDCKVRD